MHGKGFPRLLQKEICLVAVVGAPDSPFRARDRKRGDARLPRSLGHKGGRHKEGSTHQRRPDERTRVMNPKGPNLKGSQSLRGPNPEAIVPKSPRLKRVLCAKCSVFI